MNDIPRQRGQGHSESSHDGRATARSPWEVVVDVYLHSETPGDFTIQSYLQSKPGSDELVFCNNGHPGFNVTFNLHDETGLGYRFPGPPKDQDSLWSVLGAGQCPSSPGAWNIFPANRISVKGGGSAMTAFNPNPAPAQGDFSYTLNVTKDNGAHYLPLDPGGNNQNGNTGQR